MTTDNKEDLSKKYKERGFQQMSLAEYETLQAKKAKKGKLKLPTPVKYILLAPVFVVFLAGIFFIPYICYVILTSPQSKSSLEESQAPQSSSSAVHRSK